MLQREARFGDPIQVDGFTLTPLVEVKTWSREDASQDLAAGHVQPLGVLIEGPDQTRALDLDGNPLPLAGGRDD